MRGKHSVIVCLGVLALLCSGCGHTAPARFFMLDPMGVPAQQTHERKGPLIVIGPVQLADYLSRPQIASRIDTTELAFSEFNRWAEPLDSMILRILGENLSLLLDSWRIETYPWHTPAIIHRGVRLRITRFDGAMNAEAVLTAFWTITGKSDDVLASHTSIIREPVAEPGYSGLVKAQNRTLEKLCRSIADTIQNSAL
jgi:uncharacterized protein